MATTLYIDRNGFTATPDAFTPTMQGPWDADFSAIYRLAPAGHADLTTSTSLIRTVTTSSSAATVAHALCYTPPMQTTHLWSTAVGCNFVCRISEALSTMDVFAGFTLGVVSNSGVLKWETSILKDNSEAPTSLASRNNAGGYTASADYTSIPGDRMFIEVGWDKDAAIAGDVSIPYMYSTTAGDLTSTDGDTGVQNPWLSVSHTITFDVEGTTYGTNKNLMMMGCGS